MRFQDEGSIFKGERPFIELFLAGDTQPDDIDDFVGYWHEHPGEVTLREYLGFTNDEYQLWMESADNLAVIAASRRTGVPVDLSAMSVYSRSRQTVKPPA